MILRVAILFCLLAVMARVSRGALWVSFVLTALASIPVLGLEWRVGARALLAAATSGSTLRLLLFVQSIMLLSALMRRVGSLDRLGDAVRRTLGSARGGVALLPALVGLLPMPGGALFSAPLVDAAATGTSIASARRAVANYWFRHAWEFWWPLYPGIIAAVELSGIPWVRWTARMLVLTPLAVVLGWWLVLGAFGRGGASRGGDAVGSLVREMVPILLIPAVAGLSQLVSALFPRWHPDGTWVLLAAVWLSIALLQVRARAGAWEVVHAFDLRMATMGVLIVALMAYKGVIEACGMAEAVRRELLFLRMAPVPAASAVACVGGLVTGIAVGFVGSTFPIVTSVLSSAHLHYECAVGIAFLWGWAGMMLSPLHLCLLVSREHFRADWVKVYGLLLPLVVGTAALGTVWLTVLGASGRGAPVEALPADHAQVCPSPGAGSGGHGPAPLRLAAAGGMAGRTACTAAVGGRPSPAERTSAKGRDAEASPRMAPGGLRAIAPGTGFDPGPWGCEGARVVGSRPGPPLSRGKNPRGDSGPRARAWLCRGVGAAGSQHSEAF